MRPSEGFVRVLRSQDLAAAEGLHSQVRRVRVGDDEVMVGRLASGRVVAFGRRCPHEETDLEQATFVDGNVRCPKHNYIYDALSGENLIPTKVSRPENLWKLRPGYLPTYPVEEGDGWIWVSETPNPVPAGWDPAAEERPAGASRGGFASSPTHSPIPPPAAPIIEHPPKTLRVRAGAVFELRLPTEPKPGHTWRVEVPPGLLSVVWEGFEAGVPPRHRVKVAATSEGEGTLRCLYGRPWDAEPSEIRTYVVRVEPEQT